MNEKRNNNLNSFIVLFLIITIFSGFNTPAVANSYTTVSFDEFQQYVIYPGDNWFGVHTDKKAAIYVHAETHTAEAGNLEIELYNSSLSILDYDYANNSIDYWLASNNCSLGWYYIKVYNKSAYERSISLNLERYVSTNDTYEPNNWFHKAYELNIDTQIIIDASLGSYTQNLRDDIDIYEYRASEPCMLKVTLDFTSVFYRPSLSIYLGQKLLVASTNNRKVVFPAVLIENDVFYFNHTHGSIYFVVEEGYGDYTLTIERELYRPSPVYYISEPVVRQVVSELDTLTPKANILSTTQPINTYYFLVKNGNTLTSSTQQVASGSEFIEHIYPSVNISEIPNTYNTWQSDIQFQVLYPSGVKQSQSLITPFIPNESPPICDEINVIVSECSIELKVINARDDAGLAQRPYRYRIYLSDTTPPEYSEWLTSNYYNKGIEKGKELQKQAHYTIDVQIRDVTAEKYQNDSSVNLINHIRTYTQVELID